jgi:hypothetical protein
MGWYIFLNGGRSFQQLCYKNENMKIAKYIAGMMIIMLQACGSDDEDNSNTITLDSTEQTAEENAGTQKVSITLGSTLSAATQLYFELSGTASLNGDYKILTASPLTIAAGASTATISIQIIDDAIIESTESVKVQLMAAGNGIELSSDTTQNIFTLTINDNDTAPTNNNVQIDLTWGAGGDDDVDDEDLNLYIAYNVEFNDDTITDFDLYDGSENESGFESLVLPADAPDGDYYIIVAYNEGSSSVDYKINLNGAGYNNDSATGTFSSDDVGYAVFYGPLSKSGTSYGRVAKPYISPAIRWKN